VFVNQAAENAWEGEKLGAKLAIARRLMKMFLTNYYAEEHRYQIVGIELKFEGKLKDGPLFPGIGDTVFTGFIDKVDYDPMTKQYRVIDHKSAYRFDKSKIMWDIQLPLYAYVANTMFNFTDTRAVAYHILNTDANKVGIQWQYGDKGPEEQHDMLQQLNMILPLMKYELYPRRFNKNCEFCGNFKNCFKGSYNYKDLIEGAETYE
jgi:CRISPR/Cas system-associated exonuclease Cas4 (RecB family)